MKALDPRAVISEYMDHYLADKCYQSETFINYVVRGVRTYGDKFTTEDRYICVKIAKETIELLVDLVGRNRCDGDHLKLITATFNNGIIGEYNDVEIEIFCNGSKKEFMKVFNYGMLEDRKAFIKNQLTKAFIGK